MNHINASLVTCILFASCTLISALLAFTFKRDADRELNLNLATLDYARSLLLSQGEMLQCLSAVSLQLLHSAGDENATEAAVDELTKAVERAIQRQDQIHNHWLSTTNQLQP